MDFVPLIISTTEMCECKYFLHHNCIQKDHSFSPAVLSVTFLWIPLCLRPCITCTRTETLWRHLITSRYLIYTEDHRGSVH